MLIDARTIPTNSTIETEVCIVGAGPAGITLAREFVEQNFRVCLLESGSLEFDENTQSLCQGESVGDFLAPLKDQRRRQFGGTANAWKVKLGNSQLGVKYAPLDKIDFEKRDWLPYSGWPFDKSHLDPFYERAQSVCKIGPFAYEADAWKDAQTPQLPFTSDQVFTSMFQFGSGAVFTREYRDEINRSSNITTYLNANVVDIETDETARTVTRVRVACLQGNKFWVRVKLLILATGGIENARLLLLSDQVQKTGLGNQNDLIGRFFMGHPKLSCMLVPFQREIFNATALYDRHQVNDVVVGGKLVLTEDVMRREKLLNISALLLPRPEPYQVTAVRSLRTLRLLKRRAAMPKDTLKHLGNIINGIDYILPAVYRAVVKHQPLLPGTSGSGWSSLPSKERIYSMFEVVHQTEQVPDPNNRVMLNAERDRLGLRKVRLHWKFSDTDICSIKRSQKIFAEEFARAGLGQLQVENEQELPQLSFGSFDGHHHAGHHHMGATRMHVDPKQGVVDENSKVHGVSNLFIAGSSVFPTGGYVNPTLTIVALAIRLADHVKTCMVSKQHVFSTREILSNRF